MTYREFISLSAYSNILSDSTNYHYLNYHTFINSRDTSLLPKPTDTMSQYIYIYGCMSVWKGDIRLPSTTKFSANFPLHHYLFPKTISDL